MLMRLVFFFQMRKFIYRAGSKDIFTGNFFRDVNVFPRISFFFFWISYLSSPPRSNNCHNPSVAMLSLCFLFVLLSSYSTPLILQDSVQSKS